jgi:hypothetical protein
MKKKALKIGKHTIMSTTRPATRPASHHQNKKRRRELFLFPFIVLSFVK